MAEILEFKNKKEEILEANDKLYDEIDEKETELYALENQINIYEENTGKGVRDKDNDKIFDILHEIKLLHDEIDENLRSIGITPVMERPEVRQMWKDAWNDARKEQTGFSVVR